jgi:hypothetical protein
MGMRACLSSIQIKLAGKKFRRYISLRIMEDRLKAPHWVRGLDAKHRDQCGGFWRRK